MVYRTARAGLHATRGRQRLVALLTAAEPDPARVAGADLGIIHPCAVARPGGQGVLVAGRAIRAEHARRGLPSGCPPGTT